jgi:two-component system, OmpR family, response regulator AdeR
MGTGTVSAAPACGTMIRIERLMTSPDSPLIDARILIVEDEPDIADILDKFMAREGSDRLIARDGEAALEAAAWWRPDLVILDLKLPRRDGLSVLAALGANPPVPPVIILSALGDDIDKLTGFRLGCDDYVVKPFNPLEIVARAMALLRRRRDSGPRPVLALGGVRIDAEAHLAMAGSDRIDLTPVEFRLLRILAERAGRLVTRGQLVDAAMGEDSFDRSVDPHISRLRQKLERHGDVMVKVASVRGEGYRMDVTR